MQQTITDEKRAGLRRARMAVFAIFFLNGTLFTNWAARIPQVQEKIGLDERGLGLALLGLSFGVVLALPMAGGLISRFSSRSVVITAGVLNALSLPFLGLAGSFWTLAAALFAFGATTSTMDMAMNAQGVGVEKGLGKPVMSSFHAGWSLGGFTGALVGGRMAAFQIGVFSHFLIIAGVVLVLVLIMMLWLIDVEGEHQADAPTFALPHPALWMLGIIAFCAAITEGAMADWSAVYMRQVLEVSAGTAAFGLTAFTAMMTLGRLSGDWLVGRFNRVNIVRASGVLATAGLLLIITVPVTATVVIGFGLVGAGLATVVPIAFSAGGNMPGIPSSTGIAGVATVGYTGFLAGPPLIGLIAEAVSLQVAFGLVAALTTFLIIAAGDLKKARAIGE